MLQQKDERGRARACIAIINCQFFIAAALPGPAVRNVPSARHVVSFSVVGPPTGAEN